MGIFVNILAGRGQGWVSSLTASQKMLLSGLPLTGSMSFFLY